MFVDETRASTDMTRAYGRGPVGPRLVMGVPHGPRQTTTFGAASRAGGTAAPAATGGAMTGGLFAAYFQRLLVPPPRPGDIAGMGNPARHRGAAVRRAVQRAGCRLRLLPPSSPDLNPMEKAFRKLKAKLRAAGRRALEELWRSVGAVIDACGPGEGRNYFHSCGYPTARPTREPL